MLRHLGGLEGAGGGAEGGAGGSGILWGCRGAGGGPSLPPDTLPPLADGVVLVDPDYLKDRKGEGRWQRWGGHDIVGGSHPPRVTPGSPPSAAWVPRPPRPRSVRDADLRLPLRPGGPGRPGLVLPQGPVRRHPPGRAPPARGAPAPHPPAAAPAPQTGPLRPPLRLHGEPCPTAAPRALLHVGCLIPESIRDPLSHNWSHIWLGGCCL